MSAPLSRAASLKRGAGSLVAVSCMALLLQACGGSTAATKTDATKPPAQPTGNLRWATPVPPQSLDPARAGDPSAYVVAQNVYEGLTRWQQDPAKIVPALATKWETNADATKWTFTLRPGVTFTDGTPLTSEAVAKTFDHYRNGKGSFLGSYAGEYSKIETPDPQTVVINYDEPFPDLARNAPLLGIISPKALTGSRDAVSKRLERSSAGAGAFRVTAPVKGNQLRMDANPDYWANGPYLKSVTMRVVPDESARVAALRAGDIDFVLQVSPRQSRSLKAKFASSSTVTWLQSRLIFAADRPPFTDARARQAVAYALDRQVMVDKLMLGQGEVGKSLAPNGTYGYAAPALQYSKDIAKAKQLWTEAGGKGPITVAYSLTDPPAVTQLAEAAVGQLQQAGFEAVAKGLSDPQVGDELHGKKRKYDVLLLQFGWINGGPFFFTPGIFADTSSARYTGKDVLDLQDKQNKTADGPERLALLKQLQDVAQQQLFVLPVAEVKSTDVFASNVHGYVTVKDGFMYRFADTYIN